MISLCPAASPKQFTNSSINSPALAMRLCQEMLSEQFWCRLYLQDRFFSDFWSFTFDKQDPQSHHDDVVGCCSEDLLQLMLRI